MENKMSIKENGIYTLPRKWNSKDESFYKCVGYFFEAIDKNECNSMITDFELTPIGFVSDRNVNTSFAAQCKAELYVPQPTPKYYVAYLRYEGSTGWNISGNTHESIEAFIENWGFSDQPPYGCVLLKV